MSIDRDKFFPRARATVFRGSMTQPQVDGVNSLLDTWEAGTATDLRWLAYALATAFHETAATMQPIAEYGHGAGRRYGVPDPRTGHIYYGRGYVQLTWYDNYAAMSPIVGVDLVADPEKALDPKIAAKIMFYGMEHGSFTGRGLPTYFHDQYADWINARRIINGTDCAAQIAGYGVDFNNALAP